MYGHTPNIQVKDGLQIFNISFVSNNSSMKSKSNSCGPEKGSDTEEMRGVALSETKETF